MLRIYVTPAGRQQLLSNLEIRNSLYGKVLTMIVEGEDKYDENGKLLPSFMSIHSPIGNKPIVAAVDYDALDAIRAALNEST